MINIIKSVAVIFLVLAGFSCTKEKYAFGELKTPADLTLATDVAGFDATNPNGNGTGSVSISATAANAISYKIDFGDGNTQVVPSGTVTYKYSNPGTFEYTVTVNAIGTGGSVSTISKKVKVFVAFTIPTDIIANLTGGASKIWITDKDAPAHFGVGPTTSFYPDWYAAPPNGREACAYDDEITFSKDALDNISIAINNKGQSFSIGAATGSYGVSGGDNCYDIATTGTRKLVFMNATSSSTSANSTRIQFQVPGNGLINFGTGGNTYEILTISATNIFIRNIAVDGNAWYQKLKVKS